MTLIVCPCICLCFWVSYMANNMDPDQTPPRKQYEPISGFIVLASKVYSLGHLNMLQCGPRSECSLSTLGAVVSGFIVFASNVIILKCVWIYAPDVISRQLFIPPPPQSMFWEHIVFEMSVRPSMCPSVWALFVSGAYLLYYEVGIPNSMCGYTLGSPIVAYFFSGHCVFYLDLWPQFYKNCVLPISSVLYEVGIPNLVYG